MISFAELYAVVDRPARPSAPAAPAKPKYVLDPSGTAIKAALDDRALGVA